MHQAKSNSWTTSTSCFALFCSTVLLVAVITKLQQRDTLTTVQISLCIFELVLAGMLIRAAAFQDGAVVAPVAAMVFASFGTFSLFATNQTCSCFGDYQISRGWLIAFDFSAATAFMFVATSRFGKIPRFAVFGTPKLFYITSTVLFWAAIFIQQKSGDSIVDLRDFSGEQVPFSSVTDEPLEFVRGQWKLAVLVPGCEACERVFARFVSLNDVPRNIDTFTKYVVVSEPVLPEPLLPGNGSQVEASQIDREQTCQLLDLEVDKRIRIRSPVTLLLKDGKIIDVEEVGQFY